MTGTAPGHRRPRHEKEAGERALHLLLGRLHLDLAGERPLTKQEYELIRDIARWWRNLTWQEAVLGHHD